MEDLEFSKGEGKTRVQLSAKYIGDNILICITNKNAHIGAVAVAEYDDKEKRASTSVITRLGHKDDVIAYNAAYTICKLSKRTCCVVAGIHLDKITKKEIKIIKDNVDLLVQDFLDKNSNFDK